MQRRITAAAFGVLAGAMPAYPGQAAEAAWEALQLWARAVAPVLGPFMACMLMVTSHLPLPLPLQAALGWLCGSPGGARLMMQNRLTGRTAAKYALLTGTMSPMFFLGSISAWLQNRQLGLVIFLCHIAGALMALILPNDQKNAAVSAAQPMPLGTALRESALALCTIALCMMLGSTAARMAACAFPGLSPAWRAGMQCLPEVTCGVRSIVSLSPALAPAYICAACSFGGLSLLLQNAAFWQESGLTLIQLAMLRLIHALCAFTACLLACAAPGVV